MVDEKMELRLINPEEDGFPEHIDWNMDEIRSAVRNITDEYKGMVYTEDTMKLAKEDRATLNKFKKVINDRCKEVKKKCMEPYEQFKKEVDSILELIEEPIGLIDGQIKEYEEAQKKEKQDKLRTIYDDNIGDLANILSFEKVFDSRYLNVTFSFAKAAAEIKEKIQRFRMDMETIDGLDDKYKVLAKDVYIKTMDLSKALAEERRLRALDEKLEADRRAKEEAEAKRLAEEEAKRAAEAAKVPPYQRGCITGKNPNGTCPCCGNGGTVECCAQCQESCNGRCGWLDADKQEPETTPTSDIGKAIQSIERQAFEAAVSHPEPVAPVSGETQAVNVFEQQPEPPKAPVKRYKATFWCKGTLEQIKALGEYMEQNGIEFGKVVK